MNFYTHQGAYESANAKHLGLIEEAELIRQLDEVAGERPGIVTRARIAVGHLLISAGERLARRPEPAPQS